MKDEMTDFEYKEIQKVFTVSYSEAEHGTLEKYEWAKKYLREELGKRYPDYKFG